MTAPEAPNRPILIDVEKSLIRVKWYPGIGGAANYILERQIVDEGRGPGDSIRRCFNLDHNRKP